MASPFAHMLVGQLVVERPARAAVFSRIGIDYCCGGRKPLVTACAIAGLDVQRVCVELEACDAADRDSHASAGAAMSAIIDHIVNVHHTRVRSELPRLRDLLDLIVCRHQASNGKLPRLRDIFLEFAEELAEHMLKEEQVVFPFCHQLEAAGRLPSLNERIDSSILQLIREHDDGGHSMERIRTLADDYTPPPQADEQYVALLAGLRDLEDDLHRHVYEENNMLFPITLRAQQLLLKPAAPLA